MFRGGKIFAAIALENVGNANMNRVLVIPEGYGGFLPNLDLVNVVTTTSYLQDIVAGIDTYSGFEPIDSNIRTMLVFYLHTSMSFPRSNHFAFTKLMTYSFHIF